MVSNQPTILHPAPVPDPEATFKPEIQYFLPVKVNAKQGQFLVDTGNIANDDMSLLPSISGNLGVTPGQTSGRPKATVNIQILDSTPFNGLADFAVGSNVHVHDGLISAATITRRYNMIFSGKDKTLTLIPIPNPDLNNDPMVAANSKIVFLTTPMYINGTVFPVVVDSGGSGRVITLGNSTITALKLAEHATGDVTVQIGTNQVTLKSFPWSNPDPTKPEYNDINVIGIAPFLDLAGLYVTRNVSYILDKNTNQPIGSPIQGPVSGSLLSTTAPGAGLLAGININSKMLVGGVAIVMFLVLGYFAFKILSGSKQKSRRKHTGFL
jgi:hypothetical protein